MTTLSGRSAPRVDTRPSTALRYLPMAAFSLDWLVVATSIMLAVLGRNHLTVFDSTADVTASVALVGPGLLAMWLAMLWFAGCYRNEVFGVGADEFKRLLHASMYTAGLLCVLCYFTKYDLSRGFFVLAFATGIPALMLARMMLRRVLHRRRAEGGLQERAIIAGGPRQVDEIATVLRRERWLGYSVVGALVPSSYRQPETARGVPVVGHADDLEALRDECDGADILFVTGGAPYCAGDLRQIAWDIESRDIQMVVAPSVTDVSAERVNVRPVGGVPLLHLDGPRWANASRWAKRTFDIVGATCLILLALPLLVWSTLRIRLHDHGDVLFRQTRIGKDGRTFSCLKFRTMVMNAEDRLAELTTRLESDDPLFKLKRDPRVTKPGRLLRRFSIDELPQLFNVLRGDMSLVGPRPPLPREVETYDEGTARRLRVRPGMTGLWQVSGRSDLSWDDSVRLDLYYVDNWSMLQDLSILGRTFGAVLSARGAY